MPSKNGSLRRRARAAVERRRQVYGAAAPAWVDRLLRDEEAILGFWGALRLALYVLFGSPSMVLRYWWRALNDRDTPQRVRRVRALAGELDARLSKGARVLEGSFERGLYSHDLGRVPPFIGRGMYRSMPLVVAQPWTEDDLLETLDFAREEQLAVYPRGISSSAFGGSVPTRNGVVIDLSLLSKIKDIDADSKTATVEPGVRWADLATAAGQYDLVPVTTPTSRFSTIGGWGSTGGVGVDAYRYGHFTDAVLAARLVTVDGELFEIDRSDPVLQDALGTEGQMGIFTSLTIKLRQAPAAIHPRLLTFDSTAEAIELVKRLETVEDGPSHIVYFDAEHMAKERVVAIDRHGRDIGLFEARDTLLLAFESAEAERATLELLDRGGAEGSDIAARYLWSDRFFPLKAQRLGPNMLATEVVLPAARLGAFVERSRALAARFGAKVGVEATMYRDGDETRCVVIAAFACDSSRPVDYLFRLLLAQLLTHLGVRLGGWPYGLGIWNSSFIGARYSSERRSRLKARKRELDPAERLNPGKFFSVKTRFFNLPGLLFHPLILSLALWLVFLFSPVLGALARAFRAPESEGWDVPDRERDRERLLRETAQRCTLCGNCVSACPAYLITGDEQVTGRSKLQLAEVLADEAEAGEVSEEEAHSPFQCLQCGLCEEVCQTGLPLRECYLALEEVVEERFGRPRELLDEFIVRLEADKEWVERTFALDLPDWCPGREATRRDGGRA